MSAALPPGWELVPLGTFIEGFDAGANFKCDERPPEEGEVGVVKVSAVTWGEYDESASKTCRDSNRIDPSLFVQPGDLLFSRANTIELVGAAVIARRVTKNVMLSDKILRLRLRGIESEWVLYGLRAPQGRRQIEQLATGNQESMRNIGQDRIRSIMVPVAGPRTRSRIVGAIEQHLSDIDAGAAALERVRANLKRYRASVLKAACEGRLVPTEAELARREMRTHEPANVLVDRILKERRARWEQAQLARMIERGQAPRDDRWKAKYLEPAAPEPTELPDLPEGWCRVALRQIVDLVTSGSRGWGDRYADDGPLFIRAQDIKTDALRLDGVAHVDLHGATEGTRTRVQRDDVLVTITGANVTKTAVVAVELTEAYVSQHVALVRPTMGATSAFLHNWLVSPAHGRKALERLAYGAGKPGLNLDNLRNVVVALPPLLEQRRIVAEVHRLLSIADETEQVVVAQLARAARLRQAVLKTAFKGKLVSQDPTDEPASVLLERLRATGPAAVPRRGPRAEPLRVAGSDEAKA